MSDDLRRGFVKGWIWGALAGYFFGALFALLVMRNFWVAGLCLGCLAVSLYLAPRVYPKQEQPDGR